MTLNSDQKNRFLVLLHFRTSGNLGESGNYNERKGLLEIWDVDKPKKCFSANYYYSIQSTYLSGNTDSAWTEVTYTCSYEYEVVVVSDSELKIKKLQFNTPSGCGTTETDHVEGTYVMKNGEFELRSKD
jgi:hypothetical protein